MSEVRDIDVRIGHRRETESLWLLIIDRDGVLLRDTGYPHQIEDCILNEELIVLLGYLRAKGHRFGFASNQGGIGLGVYDWSAYARLTTYLNDELTARDACPDFWLACAAHPKAVLPDLRKTDHPWRKPEAGMLIFAMEHMSALKRHTVMIGDRDTDMLAAARAGVRGIRYSGWPADLHGSSSSEHAARGFEQALIKDVTVLSATIEAIMSGSAKNML